MKYNYARETETDSAGTTSQRRSTGWAPLQGWLRERLCGTSLFDTL